MNPKSAVDFNRRQQQFNRAHTEVLEEVDFFTTEVWTAGGSITDYVATFMRVASRQVWCVAALALGFASSALAQSSFDDYTNCPDSTNSFAAFKISLLPRGAFPELHQAPVLNLSDVTTTPTTVRRSRPFTAASPLTADATFCGAGATTLYSNVQALIADAPFCGAPAVTSSQRQVRTVLLSLHLTDGLGTHIRAGQSFYDSVAGSWVTNWYRDSLGGVISSNPLGDTAHDFPAQSYFNVFVEVETVWGKLGKLYNHKSPMFLKALSITSFPPDLNLPTTTYIHDPSFGAVPLFDECGIYIGTLDSAGHGSGTLDGLTISQLRLPGPLQFVVDNQSTGLSNCASCSIPAQNDVFADRSLSNQQYTVYVSPGLGNGPPDVSNRRFLVGQGFATNDSLKSFSYGRDGGNTLFFSVGRASLGLPCTEVNANATAHPSEAAACIFASSVPPFGKYANGIGFQAPGSGNNILVCDSTALGLRPMVCDTTQDNVTAFKLPMNAGGESLFGTFRGQSFTNQGARIFTWQTNAPFAPANLVVYAEPWMMGLQTNDIINALALSRGGLSPTNGQCVPSSDEVLFTLAPGSPTQVRTGGSAADVHYSRFDGYSTIFARAGDLGLLADDEVDAIDISGQGPPQVAAICGDMNQTVLVAFTAPVCSQDATNSNNFILTDPCGNRLDILGVEVLDPATLLVHSSDSPCWNLGAFGTLEILNIHAAPPPTVPPPTGCGPNVLAAVTNTFLIDTEFTCLSLSSTNRLAFLVHPYQTTNAQPNTLAWTELQLAGLEGTNTATLSGAEDIGAYSSVYLLTNGTLLSNGGTSQKYDGTIYFNLHGPPAQYFPGIPGVSRSFDNSSEEILTWIFFPSNGIFTMDINSENGFRLTANSNPRDQFATVLGEFDGARPASDTICSFVVPLAGLYPFRLITEHGTNGASLEWFSVTDSGTKILINDPNNTNSLSAYLNGPSLPAYVSALSPGVNERNVPPNTSYLVQLTDVDSSKVDSTTVSLSFNGGHPYTGATKTGGTNAVTTLSVSSSAPLPLGTNTGTLVYSLNGSTAPITRHWQFVVGPSLAAALSNGGVQLTCLFGANQTIILQRTTNLTPPNWTSIATNNSGATGLFLYTDPRPLTSSQQRFYRFQVE